LLGQRLVARGATLATAESCTGGLIAALCTDVPGSSAWFTGGVVAYANEVKRDVLGVDPALLAAHGAVSEPVVHAMAAGVRRLTGARYAVAVSGVAGPDGGTPEKPVGTVWLAVADGDAVQARRFLFPGDRAAVRQATAEAAVEALLALCGEQGPPRETDAP
jgi:nicotinamide-nucleotide amidase